jgi:hypothetical protein
MQTLDDIEAHREAVLRRWADNPRHSFIGLRADAMLARQRTRERQSACSLEGSVHDEVGGEVRLTMRQMSPLVRQLAEFGEELPRAVRHPFRGTNRQARRAADAEARRVGRPPAPSLRTRQVHRARLADFEQAIAAHPSEPPAGVHPALHQAPLDGMVSIRDELRETLPL